MKSDLKKEIYKLGYTIESFANLTGVSRWTLMDIYLDKHKKIRGDSIKRIADGLEKTYEEVEVMLSE